MKNSTKRLLSSPLLGPLTATCEHCKITLPKLKMKTYGLGNNKWTCKNARLCRDRKGWMMTHKRNARHVDYPPEFLGD